MHFISENNFAALVGTSNATVRKRAENGTFPTHTQNGVKGFFMEDLSDIQEIKDILDEPSLMSTSSPCQKQTERCHSIETAPISIN